MVDQVSACRSKTGAVAMARLVAADLLAGPSISEYWSGMPGTSVSSTDFHAQDDCGAHGSQAQDGSGAHGFRSLTDLHVRRRTAGPYRSPPTPRSESMLGIARGIRSDSADSPPAAGSAACGEVGIATGRVALIKSQHLVQLRRGAAVEGGRCRSHTSDSQRCIVITDGSGRSLLGLFCGSRSGTLAHRRCHSSHRNDRAG
jgi:hypothetical protein